jgi:hypothetical protein
MNIPFEVLWAVRACSVVIGYQRFRGHFTVKMDVTWDI